MNRAKYIFNLTMTISTATFFVNGIVEAIEYFIYGDSTLTWHWYIPLSFILVGFLGALFSAILIDEEGLAKNHLKVRITFHFLSILAIVSFFGYLFDWFRSLKFYLLIVFMYLVVYFFVWATSLWIYKKEESQINEAIAAIRDEE